MLREIFEEYESLVEPVGPVRIQDVLVDHDQVRRVVLTWHSQVFGSAGPHGFTADWHVGWSRWLVRSVAGETGTRLIQGTVITEADLMAEARLVFEAAAKGEIHDQEHRRPASDAPGTFV